MSLEQSLPGRLRSDNDIARLNGPVAGTPGANIDLQAWKTLPKEASDTAEATHLPDIAADLFLEADEDSEAELQAKDAAVRKKLDWIIVPIVRQKSFCEASRNVIAKGFAGWHYARSPVLEQNVTELCCGLWVNS